MVAAADAIVAARPERWDPVLLGAASTQYANLVRACELCLDRDAAPDRAFRLLLPMFAAVHEGRPTEVLGSSAQRVLERWSDADAPWRAEVLAVLATAAAIAGRHDDVAPLAASRGRRSGRERRRRGAGRTGVGLASPRRTTRRRGPPLRARPRLAADARRVRARWPWRWRRSGRRARPRRRDATRRSTLLAGVLRRGARVRRRVRGRARPPRVAAGCCCAAGDVDAAPTAELAEARRVGGDGPAVVDGGDAADARPRVAVVRPGRMGRRARARGGEAVDFAASRGCARRGRDHACARRRRSAQHLGEHEQAAVLLAAVPRSSAITVLPELFPRGDGRAGRGAPAPPAARPPRATRSRGRGRRSTASGRRRARSPARDRVPARGGVDRSPSWSLRATPGASASAAAPSASAT